MLPNPQHMLLCHSQEARACRLTVNRDAIHELSHRQDQVQLVRMRYQIPLTYKRRKRETDNQHHIYNVCGIHKANQTLAVKSSIRRCLVGIDDESTAKEGRDTRL